MYKWENCYFVFIIGEPLISTSFPSVGAQMQTNDASRQWYTRLPAWHNTNTNTDKNTKRKENANANAHKRCKKLMIKKTARLIQYFSYYLTSYWTLFCLSNSCCFCWCFQTVVVSLKYFVMSKACVCRC